MWNLVSGCFWLLMNEMIQSFLICFLSLWPSQKPARVRQILPPGQRCLCIGLVGGWRPTPGRGVLGSGNLWRGRGGQTMMAPWFHWHACACWAWLTTWRTYGWKTMLTTIWISMPSDTSWGLSTTCVSLWGCMSLRWRYPAVSHCSPGTNVFRLIDGLTDISDV